MNVCFREIRTLLPDMTLQTVSVCTQDGRILSVGEIPAGFTPDTVIEGRGRLLMPGLVNAHTHAYMTMFRGCADDLPFTDWLVGHIDPLEAQMTEEDCYWASLLADLEQLQGGITASLDMFIFPETAARAAEESGIRAVLSRGLTGPDGGRRLREATDEIAARRGKNSRITYVLGPHAPYSCSEEYLKEVAAAARELDLGLNIHISESQFEQDTIRNDYSCTPTELLDRCGILGPRTVAAHGVWLSDSDIALLAERGTSVATNPVSNLKLGNGIAPIPKLLRAGVNVALGTDGSASNNALNLFRELNFVTLLHKGVTGDPTTVTAAEGLKMATVGGAKALGLTDCGVIRPGARADLTVLDIDRPYLRPANDLVSSLCYCANGSEPVTVMVDGKFVMKDREMLTLDRERILWEVDRTCRRLGILKD